MSTVPPKWVIEPQDASVLRGRTALIDCQADGFPPPSIHWSKTDGNTRYTTSSFSVITILSLSHAICTLTLLFFYVMQGQVTHLPLNSSLSSQVHTLESSKMDPSWYTMFKNQMLPRICVRSRTASDPDSVKSSNLQFTVSIWLNLFFSWMERNNIKTST